MAHSGKVDLGFSTAMLESFRGRFNVFRKKKPTKNREVKEKNQHECNENAGADVLARYQREWMLLHQIAEENADKAKTVYDFINKLRSQCDKQHELLGQLTCQLTLVPKLSQYVQSLAEETDELGKTFEKVNSALVNLEHVIEIQELQEKRLEQKFQLTLFKERKTADLERLKLELANEHVQKVRAYESRQQTLLKEREETFREVFEEELNHYKIHGRIEIILKD
uniref:Uncharacterized protein n=1 Tax=Strigamia maritima TaxID=126957 RepID=T1J255_STRMM